MSTTTPTSCAKTYSETSANCHPGRSSRPESGLHAQLCDRFRAQRIAGASAIVAAAEAEWTIDATLDPGVVIERIVGPIWFRIVVLRNPVDQGHIDSVVYAVA